MIRRTTLLAATAGLLGLAPGALAQDAVFEVIGPGYATDVSADGSAITGNTNFDYAAFIWTEANPFVVSLGNSPAAFDMPTAGLPGISADGTRISQTIVYFDPAGDVLRTIGRWDSTTDWSTLLPPLAPGGGELDRSLGSAWGISADGHTVVGLFWRPDGSTGSAHACAWTDRNGTPELIDLVDGVGPGSSRADDVSADGSVVVGWNEDDTNRQRQAAVWVNGAETILRATGPLGDSSEANAVSDDGLVVGGTAFDETITSVATIWKWDGQDWVETQLGALPGTIPTQGIAGIDGFNADGSIAVGFSRPAFSFYFRGFVWTEATGMVEAEEYFESLGAVIPSTFSIWGVSAVSADGSTFVGYGYDTSDPVLGQSFRVTVPVAAPVCACDWNADSNLNDQDFFDWTNDFFSASGPQGGADFNDDGFENDQDWFDFANCFFTPPSACL